MQDEGSDAQQVKVNGWRQGSILNDALVWELTDAGKLPSYSGEGRWIVISHDAEQKSRRLTTQQRRRATRVA